MIENKTPERIAALRAAMREHDVAACLVPSADPHLSEYLPGRWQARAWLSGFTGSAGTLIVTQAFAGLWTDSRYFEQAERQLAGSGVELVRLKVPHQPEHLEWLTGQLGSGDTLAVDGACLSLAAQRRLQSALASCETGIRTDLDLPGMVWSGRPDLPGAAIYEQPPEYAIRSRRDKLAELRDAIRHAGATHHLASALDEIAWLTNLRGSDVECNPVFLAHLLVDAESATLFVGAGKLPQELVAQLAADGFTVADYGSVESCLASLPDSARLLLDPAQVVTALAASIPAAVTRIEQTGPLTRMKAVKSEGELAHIRTTMREDGAALVQAFHRIESALKKGETVSELDVDAWLHEARAARPGFVGESFATIAGYMANGALPHYRATPESHARLGRDGLLLVDSGGQYLGGTTDITRMWAFGRTTPGQRRDVALVLKGMIRLSLAHFPAGASGPQLDALARAPLWRAGLDFGHGTGHGVGYFLNVHEGPHGIRPPAPGGALVALQPGMITSIEPGAYKPGRHGVRHENLAVVVEAEETEFGRFFAFDTLTLCPIDTRALDIELLDDQERDWLNAYHARVETELAPMLDDLDRAWLHARCKPV